MIFWNGLKSRYILYISKPYGIFILTVFLYFSVFTDKYNIYLQVDIAKNL